MDSELLELQRLFETTQEKKATVRLSERNVVELVAKLQELHLLDFDLLHTVTGKEYITREQLKVEVEAEVKRLGRLSLVDLAATVGVELVHCERVAEQISADRAELTVVQGEIIADTYWDAVADEVNEALQESGQISVGELAKHYNVGAELLTRALQTWIGKSGIQGKLEAGQLYTPAFVARIRAMVRGALRALTVPTSLSEVRASLQQELTDADDGPGGVPGLFQSVLHSVISAGEVKGALKGGGVSWVPAVFAHSQKESVESFYSQNGYIDYDFLRKLLISQPKAHLQENFPEGAALETVFVHRSLISVVDAATEEALNGGGWVDTLPLVPTSFAGQDIAMLVQLCPSVVKALKESTAVVLAETCVVSLKFVKTLVERLEAELSTLAANAAKREALRRPELNSVMKPEKPESEAGSSARDTMKKERGVPEESSGKNSRKKRGGQQHVVKDSKVMDVAEEEPRGKSRKRGGGKSKGGIGSLVGESGTGVSKGSDKKEDVDFISEEQLAETILLWFPDMETAGLLEGDEFGESGGMLARSLATLVTPSVLATWSVVKHAKTNAGGSEERRRRMDYCQRKLDEGISNLQLFAKAMELFEDDGATFTILQRHLLRTTAAELVDLFLTAQNLERQLEEGESTVETEGGSVHPLTSGMRVSLASQLSAQAVGLVEALEGKSIEAFDAALDAALQEGGLRGVKKPDKKSERSLLHSHKKVLTTEVDAETDPIALLPKVVALLYIQVHNRALQAPGRAMAAAVARLKSAISDDNHEILVEYHRATVTLLSLQATAAPDGNGTDCTSDRLRTKREALVDRMPVLKSIAIPNDGSSKINKP